MQRLACFWVPRGQGSHWREEEEKTAPASQSNTSCGSSHASSPPGQIGAPLLSRSSRPACHRHVGTPTTETEPFAPVVGRTLPMMSGTSEATRSPISSYATLPDAPSKDTVRMASSSAVLSTPPSDCEGVRAMAMATVHTASYSVAQYWSHSSAFSASVYDSAPSSTLSVR
eukprot:1701312-Rhodomonas_salina.1